MRGGTQGRTGKDFAEQGEKEFGVFDLVCSLPWGNLSWVSERTTECVIRTTDHILQLSRLTGKLEAEGQEFWLHWTVGAGMRGTGSKCRGQTPSSPFLVPRPSGFGVTSGSLRGDTPDRLSTYFSGQHVRDTQK